MNMVYEVRITHSKQTHLVNEHSVPGIHANTVNK